MKESKKIASGMRSKTNRSREPIVTLNLRTGPISPAQRAAGERLWAKLLAKADGDMEKDK